MDGLADSLARLPMLETGTDTEIGVANPNPIMMLYEDTLTGILVIGCDAGGACVPCCDIAYNEISVEKLMRIALVCAQFQSIAHRLAPGQVVEDIKWSKMVRKLTQPCIARFSSCPISQAYSTNVSRLVDYIFTHADMEWHERGPHARTLAGDLGEAVRRCMDVTSPQALHADHNINIVKAYCTDFVNLTAFDPVPILEDNDFMHPSSSGLLAPATLNAILCSAKELGGDNDFDHGGPFNLVTSVLTRVRGIDVFLSNNPETTLAEAEHTLLNTAFHFCFINIWPRWFFTHGASGGDARGGLVQHDTTMGNHNLNLTGNMPIAHGPLGYLIDYLLAAVTNDESAETLGILTYQIRAHVKPIRNHETPEKRRLTIAACLVVRQPHRYNTAQAAREYGIQQRAVSNWVAWIKAQLQAEQPVVAPAVAPALPPPSMNPTTIAGMTAPAMLMPRPPAQPQYQQAAQAARNLMELLKHPHSSSDADAAGGGASRRAVYESRFYEIPVAENDEVCHLPDIQREMHNVVMLLREQEQVDFRPLAHEELALLVSLMGISRPSTSTFDAISAVLAVQIERLPSAEAASAWAGITTSAYYKRKVKILDLYRATYAELRRRQSAGDREEGPPSCPRR